MRNEIPSLYVLKGIAAICVVLAHTSLGDYSRLVQVVPVDIGITSIFYAITGYFLFTEDDERLRGKLQKTILKVIPIILITQAVYTIFRFPLPDFSMANKIYYFKWILMGDGSGPLWYLTALLEGLIALWLFVRIFGTKYISILLLFIFVRFACEDYWEVLFDTPRTNLEKNFLAYSVPMLTAGYLIHKYEEKLLKLCNYTYLFLFLVVLIYANEYYLKDILPPYIQLRSLINGIASSIIILMALQHKSVGKGYVMEFIGKELSANIYYWHGLFSIFYSSILPPRDIDYYNWSFFYILFPTMLLAWLIYWIQKKCNIHIL